MHVLRRTAEAQRAAAVAQPHVTVANLGRQFGGADPYWAVKRSNFEVARGEFFGLLGPSGCGKSTTLNLIAGFLDPTEGEVRLSGKLLNGVPPHQRGCAMVFQDYALFPHLSAADNVAFGPRLQRRPADRIRARVAELLELVGLGHRANNLPAQLSGGEQQRVALARALAVEPEVVLLDEPLSNLDARLRVQMRRHLKRILSTAGVTVIFVTHDQAEAFAICDRVAVMRGGRIEDLGPPARLYARPRTQAVARFVGEGNFFAAQVLGRAGNDRVSVRVSVGHAEREAVVSEFCGSSPGTRGCVLVRPESIVLGDRDLPGPAAIVQRAEFLGAVTQYELTRDDAPILAHVLSRSAAYRPGDTASIGWRGEEGVFLPDEAS